MSKWFIGSSPSGRLRRPTKRQLAAERRLARDLADIHLLWEPGAKRTQVINAFIDLHASKEKP